ncbi:hypothetical protein PTKU15_76720 [Paraburkholderia terrae]|nr:hypothetical protein PTKU15_76720 [Paraburkholderia terrae]
MFNLQLHSAEKQKIQALANGNATKEARLTAAAVVPRGDSIHPNNGYWMSPHQAQAVAITTQEQAGQALGLPAAQAANILNNGVDFYSITPKSGSVPNVFGSDIAGTSQGNVVTSPFA